MKYLINLTPHTINVVGCEPIEPSGIVARVSTTSQPAYTTPCGVPLTYQTVGEVTGLPDLDVAHEEAIYIVSTQVRLALPNRFDLASPGELVRDDKGQPVGCTSLVVNVVEMVGDKPIRRLPDTF